MIVLDPKILTGEKPFEALSHDEILLKLKDQCKKIDFQERVYPDCVKIKKEIQELTEKLKVQQTDIHAVDSIKAQIELHEKTLEDFKVKTKHYLIITIEEIMSTAKENNWAMCLNCGFVYLYNGQYWKAIDKEGLTKFFGEIAELFSVPKFEARFYSFRESLLKQFIETAHLPRPVRTRRSILINFRNGTLEIKSGKPVPVLRSFSSEDFLTHQLPFDYEPSRVAPIWQNFLDFVLPDKERQNVLAEYFASAFVNNEIVKLEKVLMMYGTGANGKGVVYEVICSLFGEENISSYSLTSLTDSAGYYRAMITNKLLNYSSENGVKVDSNIFKQLASNEPVEARLPYNPPFQAKNYAKLVFNTNMLPKDGVEQTDAFFRRFLIVPFDVTIPEGSQDKELHLKIIGNELPGVFNWLMEGLNRLLKQKGFSECKAATIKLVEYRNQSDSVREFLDEAGYIKSINSHSPMKSVYAEYKFYCSESGLREVSLKTFSNRLRDSGYETRKTMIGQLIYLTK
ncbi:MAG TPA: phage/plasmid primase, P4 family [Chitinophagaceae bacterium]|nr:phage/plasmid primase, P4 family [Chitinophagaceae bacterium]